MGRPVIPGRGPDVRIIDSGAVFLFLLVTPEARAWVEAHTSPHEPMLGIELAVEPRYAVALAEGMAGDGLTVAGDDLYAADDAPRAGSPGVAAADVVQTVICTPRQSPTSDRYDLGWLFACWVWESGCRDWNHALRALARTLRGLERIGVIERRTLRRAGAPTHHGFVLTHEGRQAVSALSGDWIEEAGESSSLHASFDARSARGKPAPRAAQVRGGQGRGGAGVCGSRRVRREGQPTGPEPAARRCSPTAV
jgi:hypothetical protein